MRKFILALGLLSLVSSLIPSVGAQSGDTTPPVISNVRAEGVIGPGAQIKWTTDDPSDSRVLYGLSSGNLAFFSSSRCDAGGNVTDHCVNLTELLLNTVYYYKVESKNALNLDAQVSGFQFTSAGGSSPAAPSNLTATLAPNGTDVNLSWTDNSSNEGDFKVLRRPSSGSWAEIATVGVNATSYTDAGRAPGTYDYHVNACNTSGCSPDSNIVTVTVSSPAPAAPSNLRLDPAPSQTAIYLKWNDNSSNEDKFNVDRAIAGGTAWTFLSQSGANAVSYTDSGVTSGTHYDYRVQACLSESGCSAYVYLYDVVTVSSSTSTSTDTTAPVFSSVRAEGITSSGAQIRWTTDDPSDSKVIWGTSPNNYPNTATARCDTGGNVTDHCVTLSGLNPSTSYYYKAVSRNAAGMETQSLEYGFGTPVTGSTGSSVTIPNAPLNLSASVAISGAEVFLSWMDNSANEAEFKVYQRPAGGSWSLVRSLGVNATSSGSITLPTGTHEFYVVACNTAGCSSFSNTVSTASAAAAPSTLVTVLAPNGGECIPAGSSVQVNWSSSLTDVNYWGIRYQFENSTSFNHIGDVFTSGTRSYAWFVPSGLEGYVRVKVEAWGQSATSLGMDFSDGAFRVSASCGTSTTAATTIDLGPAPYVTAWGLGIDGTRSTIGIGFGREMDQTSFTDANVFFHRASDPPEPAYRVPVTYVKNPYYVSVVPNSPLAAGTEYVSVVKQTVRSAEGAAMTSDYVCRFVALASGYYASCPGGGVAAPSATADATVDGKVFDGGGITVPGASIRIFKENFLDSFGAVTDVTGSFRISVRQGTYLAEIIPPYGRADLIKPAPQKFSVESGGSKTLRLEFGSTEKANKVISGKVTFSDDAPVNDAEVGAYSESSGQWTSALTDQGGSYVLRVGPGVWVVGFHPRDPEAARWHFRGAPEKVEFKNDTSTETRSVNFTVPRSRTKVVARVLSATGAPLAGAGVVLDAVSGEGGLLAGANYAPPEFRKSDENGFATFFVTPGVYYLRAFLPPERGLLNPDEARVEVKEGEEREVRLPFKRRELATTATVRGTARLEDGSVVTAFVWGWSEEGGFADTKARDNGEFTLTVTLGSRWHLGAGKEVNGYPYKSSEVTVEVNKPDVTIELLLSRFGNKPLPPPVMVNQPATQRVVAQAQDGAKLEIPENAAAVSGSLNVQMNSTVEAPSQAATKVVSTVWDITVSDQSGNKVEKFTKDAEIVLPYDEDDLKDQGVTEDTIVPSFFDESTGTWVTITNYTVDKVKNVVIARVDHLTRFAIVAAADVTPPDAPTSVKVASGGQGILLVSWTNPTKDFDHAKVYRSATKGELGEVVGSDVISGGLEDSGLQNGVTYYYTVRAVDPAGNESANTVQTGAVAVGSSVKPKPLPAGQATKLEILRMLTVGSEGSDVRTLQELLLAEGVYPDGLITGFFGNLTREAVIRFQEKYAAEILTPGGLTRGNGVVGPATRKKTNALLGGGGAGQPSALPPGQAVKVRILVNLQKGVTSDDVRTLQELLLNEGVYPEGLITGFFGELTKQAVIRFQEKYADEILVPAGLTSGTGYVGSATRAKINKLLE